MFWRSIRAGPRERRIGLWLNFGLFGWNEKVWEIPGYTSLCCPWLVFGAIIAQVTNVRQCLRRQAGKAGWFLAFALVFLVCVLPANADTLRTKHAVAPDQLFDPSILSTVGELAPPSPDSILGAEELQGRFLPGFAPLRSGHTGPAGESRRWSFRHGREGSAAFHPSHHSFWRGASLSDLGDILQLGCRGFRPPRILRVTGHG